MKTLYDLLGALSDDSGDAVRIAFRKAVKGSHPDLNPGDPDAGFKFRQIVRANEILSDEEQRAAYDHLLDLARVEQQTASRHAVTATIYRLASGTIALVGLCATTIGGYLLFMHISAASVAAPGPASTPGAAPPEVRMASASAVDVAPLARIAARAIPSYRPRYAAACCTDEPNGAPTDIDLKKELDPRFSAAYIDRNLVFYRPQSPDHPFAESDLPKRVGQQDHRDSGPTVARSKRTPHRVKSPQAPPPRLMAQQDHPPFGFPFIRSR